MKILFINHSLEKTGAPMVLYYFLEWIKNNKPQVKTTLFSLQDGSLNEMFSSVVDRHVVNTYPLNVVSRTIRLLKRKIGFDKLNQDFVYSSKIRELLRDESFDLIYMNTVVGLPTVIELKKQLPSSKAVIHVHELANEIKDKAPCLMHETSLFEKYIAASELVQNALVKDVGVDEAKTAVVYECSRINDVEFFSKHAQEEKLILGGAGLVGERKGVDLFIEVAYWLKKHFHKPFEMHWLGKMDAIAMDKYMKLAESKGVKEEIKFLGFSNEVDKFYNSLDLFLMTSREDPFPLVCIEAANYQVPILCFQNATGTQEFLSKFEELIVPAYDTEKMAKNALNLVQDKERYQTIGRNLKQIFQQFSPENQMPKLWGEVEAVLNRKNF